MRALITGASSGLGYALAKDLSSIGYELILVGRDRKKLEKLKNEVMTSVKIMSGDLCHEDFLLQVIEEVKHEDVTMLINNAGMGIYGRFETILDEEEQQMLLLNMIVPDCLMRAYIQHHIEGRIINISSIASNQTDPLMAGYGASKSFLTMLSKSVMIELKKHHSSIKIQLCLPGNFDSSFNQRAHIQTPLKGDSAQKISELILKDIFKNKKIIIPGFKNKIAYYSGKLIPEIIMNNIEYYIQSKKQKPHKDLK